MSCMMCVLQSGLIHRTAVRCVGLEHDEEYSKTGYKDIDRLF